MKSDLQPSSLSLGGQKCLEVFVAQPTSVGSLRGAILFVHGHQEDRSIGGRGMADDGALSRIANWRSIIAASVSQPGYGGSSGPPDFCGPATQSAIRVALDYLEKEYGLERSSIVLYGGSRGAIAGAMVASQEPALGGLILVAGTYDLKAAYERTLPGICANIEAEAGTTKEAFMARSALFHADKIRADTCILHGRQDDRAPVDQAVRFAETVKLNAPATLSLFDCGHFIPHPLRRPAVLPLYDKIFGKAPEPGSVANFRPGTETDGR